MSPIGSMLAMLTWLPPLRWSWLSRPWFRQAAQPPDRRPRFRQGLNHRIRFEVYQGLCAGGVCCGCCEGFDLGGDVADVFEREGQGQGVGDGVDVVQTGGEEELPGQELGDGTVDHVRVPERVLLPRGLVVGHQVRDFFARDGGICLRGDVPVQEQAHPQQHDGLHPAQRTLLAKDAGTGAASNCVRIDRAQYGDLPFVVQLHGEEQFGQPAAQDDLVIQQDGPEFLVPAAVHVGALEKFYQRLPHLHGQHTRIAGEEGGAVYERVPGSYREGVGVSTGSTTGFRQAQPPGR
jgi:hypothetical protein